MRKERGRNNPSFDLLSRVRQLFAPWLGGAFFNDLPALFSNESSQFKQITVLPHEIYGWLYQAAVRQAQLRPSKVSTACSSCVLASRRWRRRSTRYGQRYVYHGTGNCFDTCCLEATYETTIGAVDLSREISGQSKAKNTCSENQLCEQSRPHNVYISSLVWTKLNKGSSGERDGIFD